MNTNKQSVEVTVAGGYNPQVITLKKGIPAEITFNRINDQARINVVHSKSLGFSEELPLNVKKTVQIPTDKVGDYQFSCGMDMFSGKVEVK
ncbi:cupredoxin domain-containing protein [Lentilactobacillus kisonensis]|nr:cupredoxin domain-containing protein [Lentilactobacillus kisonensis]